MNASMWTDALPHWLNDFLQRAADTGWGRTLLAAAGIVLGVYLGWRLVKHIAYAIPLYRLAASRANPHAWLAWIPVGQAYILGFVADDICRARQDKNPGFHWWMTGLSAASLLSRVPYIGWLMAAARLALWVFELVSLYKIWEEHAPQSRVVWLILAILSDLLAIIGLWVAAFRAPRAQNALWPE